MTLFVKVMELLGHGAFLEEIHLRCEVVLVMVTVMVMVVGLCELFSYHFSECANEI